MTSKNQLVLEMLVQSERGLIVRYLSMTQRMPHVPDMEGTVAQRG